MLNTRDVHSLTDFLRNHKSHMARMKESRQPEVLTVHGRPELVLLTAESYQHLLDRLSHMEAVSATRAIMARHDNDDPEVGAATQVDIDRSQSAIKELMAETQRLGLYQ